MTSFTPTLAVINDIPRASSLDIAEHFGKRHVDVMRAINKSIMQVPEDFAQRNFAFSEYLDSTGRTLPKCDLTHDGFSFVVMGFTGKEAAKWKVVYITAFRAMADELAAQRGAALPNGPHIAITPSTTASRKPLEKLVKVWARQSGLIVGDCWTMLNAAFNLQSITELPEEWIPDAIAWVQGKIDNLTPALPAAEPVPAPALPATDDIDGHFAAIREHIRQINNHEEAIFQAVRKGMPPLRDTGHRSSLALLIHRNMENAGWSLHYALKSLETSARIAVTAGQI